jgi:hypothetical protein
MEELKGGRPITIVTPTDDHEFVLDEDALREVLFNPAIKDKHVVVLSVAGAFRKGKSFLLDFFLRYLRSNGSEDWLGPRDDPLTGFSWRGGMDRDTTGGRRRYTIIIPMYTLSADRVLRSPYVDVPAVNIEYSLGGCRLIWLPNLKKSTLT